MKFGYQILLIIILSILFGFAAGLVGELWLDDFLTNGIASDQKLQTLSERLDELTQRQEKKLKDILGEKDLSINQTIEDVRPAIVSFYSGKKQIKTYADILLDEDLLGVGVILTADGWILTDKQLVAQADGQVVVTFKKEVYLVEANVCDKSTQACFVKIAAEDLPVVNLTSREFLTSGQTALAISSTETFPTSIKNLYYTSLNSRSDLIHSSEKFYHFIKLTENLDKKWIGAPVVNLHGQVFGIVSTDNLVIAIDDIQNIMKQAIGEGQITRNFLGVNYIDLSQAVGWEKYSEQKSGALIFGGDQKPAVLANSPAQKAGLAVNDIITAVEDEQITQTSSLTSLIQSYNADEEIKLTILRGEEEVEINVVLTDQ